jgi:hypothetical protein
MSRTSTICGLVVDADAILTQGADLADPVAATEITHMTIVF